MTARRAWDVTAPRPVQGRGAAGEFAISGGRAGGDDVASDVLGRATLDIRYGRRALAGAVLQTGHRERGRRRQSDADATYQNRQRRNSEHSPTHDGSFHGRAGDRPADLTADTETADRLHQLSRTAWRRAHGPTGHHPAAVGRSVTAAVDVRQSSVRTSYLDLTAAT